MTTHTLICGACGYQWDESMFHSTFNLYCPACEANMVYKFEPTKEQVMGEDYDGQPWY